MQPGSRLGPYEILEPLGAGGMGEVYAAQDSRLGRRVAIKVLPATFAADPERRARFEQEARAAAALNHPHIAAIHDVGVGEDPDSGEPVHFIVQELLDGSTLQDALEGQRWRLPRILAVSTEVAEALAAAHAAGIVHRDLKPANVFVTEQGHAKVLDFGLAKLTEPAGPGAGDATFLGGADQSPTVLGTVAGQIMGTAGYMAPEQIEGGPVDGRTDVFAFGCVLYEMCAGRRPFAGRSVLQTLDLVLHEDPAPLAPGPATPARLLWILDKCLAKEPDLRYQSAAELVVDLRRLAADVAAGRLDEATGTLAQEEPAKAKRGLPVLAAAALVLAAVLATTGVMAWLGAPEPPASPVRRFETALPSELAFGSIGRPSVAISPGGHRVAIATDGAIWARAMDAREFRLIRGTEGGGRAPVFSPSGEEILFWRDDELLRVAVDGMVPVPVVAAENPWGLRWLSDDTILYGQGSAGIWRVSAAGGDPERLYEPAPGESVHGPQLLRGGRWLLMTVTENGQPWDEGRIVARSLESDEVVELVRGGRDGRALASGHLVYARGNTVLAQRFDEETLTVTGPPVPVIEGVMDARDRTGTSHFDVSDDGTLVYAVGEESWEDRSQRLVWAGEDWEIEETALPEVAFGDYRLSPDGTRVAAIVAPDTLMVFDLASGVGQRAAEGVGSRAPVWSPDQRWIYYTQDLGQRGAVYRVAADASSAPEAVVDSDSDDLAPVDISADGAFLVIRSSDRAQGGGNLLRYRLEERRLEELVTSSDNVSDARLSPDGAYLAYEVRRPAPSAFAAQVLVLELTTGARQAVSAVEDVATTPRWSTDGDSLYYIALRENTSDLVKVVAVSRTDGLRPGRPRDLMTVDPTMLGRNVLDVFQGRLLVSASSRPENEESRAARDHESLVFVTGFFDVLRERLDDR